MLKERSNNAMFLYNIDITNRQRLLFVMITFCVCWDIYEALPSIRDILTILIISLIFGAMIISLLVLFLVQCLLVLFLVQ